MKNVNIIGMLLVILLGNNQSFATTGKTAEIPSQEQTVLENNQSTATTEVLETFPSLEQTVLRNNRRFTTIAGLEDIANLINNPLRRKLYTFKFENPQFDYGIGSIDHLYDQGIKVDDLYESEESSPLLRKTTRVLRIIAEGACGAVRALSIFHPDDKFVGRAIGMLHRQSILKFCL